MSTSSLEEDLTATSGCSLTKRENDVLTELCKGKSNKQIALALGIAVPTVRNHLAAVMCKLNVGSRCEIVAHLASNAPRGSVPVKQDDSLEASDCL